MKCKWRQSCPLTRQLRPARVTHALSRTSYDIFHSCAAFPLPHILPRASAAAVPAQALAFVCRVRAPALAHHTKPWRAVAAAPRVEPAGSASRTAPHACAARPAGASREAPPGASAVNYRLSVAPAPRRSHHAHVQARLAVAAAACCAAYALLALRRLATAPAPAEAPATDVCVAWRATTCGTQYSGRLPLEDLHCSALIRPSDKRISGARRMRRVLRFACTALAAWGLRLGASQRVAGRILLLCAALRCAALQPPRLMRGTAVRFRLRVLRVRRPAPGQGRGGAAVRQRPAGGVEERCGAPALASVAAARSAMRSIADAPLPLRVAARMRPFTCQEACEAKWKRRGPTRREDPHAGCDSLPAEASRPGGRSWADVAPPPLQPAQADAVRALWNELDEAFLVRACPAGLRWLPGSDASCVHRRLTACLLCCRRDIAASAAGRAPTSWRRGGACPPLTWRARGRSGGALLLLRRAPRRRRSSRAAAWSSSQAASNTPCPPGWRCRRCAAPAARCPPSCGSPRQSCRTLLSRTPCATWAPRCAMPMKCTPAAPQPPSAPASRSKQSRCCSAASRKFCLSMPTTLRYATPPTCSTGSRISMPACCCGRISGSAAPRRMPLQLRPRRGRRTTALRRTAASSRASCCCTRAPPGALPPWLGSSTCRARCIIGCCARTWARATKRPGPSRQRSRAARPRRGWPRRRALRACRARSTPSTCSATPWCAVCFTCCATP